MPLLNRLSGRGRGIGEVLERVLERGRGRGMERRCGEEGEERGEETERKDVALRESERGVVSGRGEPSSLGPRRLRIGDLCR